MNIKFIKKFVEESDAIERIYHKGVSQYLHDHMSTAMHVINEAEAGRLVDSRDIHKQLMRETLGDEAGKYRTVTVRVGNFFPVDPITVPHAMELFCEYIKAIIENKDQMTDDERHDYSWKAHAYYEMCHPYTDGNGRSGRLLWLGLRLILGLRPTIVYESEKENYYRALENFQRTKVTQ